MKFTLNFQPRQIVCLEHLGTCLYAEVIQVIGARQLCWVRPLLLSVQASSQESEATLPLNDLRLLADLIWPVKLFRPALDTEVIPLLTQLLVSEPQPEHDPVAQQRFDQFIHQVWQAHQARFNTKETSEAP